MTWKTHSVLSSGVKKNNKWRRERRRQWLIRRCRRLTRRRRNIKLRQRPSLLSRLPINEFTKRSAFELPGRKIAITLPAKFNFDKDYESTCSHLRLLRAAVTTGVKISTLDFSQLEEISTSAALALASEVDLWNRRGLRRLRAALETWHPSVQKLLLEMGYFELLGIKKPDHQMIETDLIFLRFKRGDLGESTDGGEISVELRTEIENVTQTEIRKIQLFGGLSEAITNVGHHAYDQEGDPKLKQWWVTSSFNVTSRELQVTFYDHGKGIPETLPAWKHFNKIRDIFGTMSHSEKIRSAVQLGKTSTDAIERGQGLQDLLGFSRAYSKGCLTIYSLKGKYRSLNDNGKIVEDDFSDRSVSIGGTLIEWSVTIDQKQNESN